MRRLRGTLLAIVLGTGAVLVPAEKSEAGLFDCVWRIFCPWRCDPCAAPVLGCPQPVVAEGAYCNPCQTCTTSFVCRSYMEPRVCMTRQCRIEVCPSFVRRSYWDPCSVCYRTYLEPTSRYVKRCYQVPVTTYVQRSYLEPVTTCTTPACPNACPLTTPEPTPEPLPAVPGTPATEGSARRNAKLGKPASPATPPAATTPKASSPYRTTTRTSQPADRGTPLATSFARPAMF